MCGGVQMSVFMPDVFECVREYERVFTRVCFTCVKVPICSMGTWHPYPAVPIAGPVPWIGWSLAQGPGLRGEAAVPCPLAGPGPFQSSLSSSEAWALAFLVAGASGVCSSVGRC